MNALASRWLKFNFVGGVGIAVQLTALWLFKGGMHMHYLVATALAVEFAVLHNFVWHERFTWKDRAGGSRGAVLKRLVRFHAGNGIVSIAGNLALMRLFVGAMHIKYIVANMLTIAICSFLNFVASEWFVFRESQ